MQNSGTRFAPGTSTLPTFCNYGVGSAGFGAYRELVANIKTTNWVLGGEIETFPLLYHYRVREVTGITGQIDIQRHLRYVEYWGGNEGVRRYMLDRAGARHELVLFLEHIPEILHPWLLAHPGRAGEVLEQLRSTLNFLWSKGIVHFDAHFHNILVDEDRPYLTDFGLVLDRRFGLSPEEEAFLQRHADYDLGEVLSCLSYLLDDIYTSLPELERASFGARHKIDDEKKDYARLRILLAEAEDLRAASATGGELIDLVLSHREAISLMLNFYQALQGNSEKDTPFPDKRLGELLRAT